MASHIMNVPLNVGSVKGLGCLSHGNFNPNALQIRRSISSKPHCSMLAVKACMSNGEYEAKIAGNIHEAQPVPLMPTSPAGTREACSSDEPMRKSGMSNEECEAAVVAGNIPEAPPVPPVPASPVGTPVAAFDIRRRPRRNRKSPVLRSAFQETSLRPANFVYPLFIHEGEEDIPIDEIRGCYRLGWRHGLLEEVAKARDVGVNTVLLFPKVPNALKTPTGDEAYNDNGLLPRTIRLLKDKFPDLVRLKVDKEFAKFRDTNLEIYETHYAPLFRDCVAVGDQTMTPLQFENNSNLNDVQGEEAAEGKGDSDEINLGADDSFFPSFVERCSGKRKKSKDVVNKRLAKSKISTFEEKLDVVLDALSTKNTRTSPQNGSSPTIADCMNIVTTFPDFYEGSRNYAKALRVFIKKQNREAFMFPNMDEAKMEFLMLLMDE